MLAARYVLTPTITVVATEVGATVRVLEDEVEEKVQDNGENEGDDEPHEDPAGGAAVDANLAVAELPRSKEVFHRRLLMMRGVVVRSWWDRRSGAAPVPSRFFQGEMRSVVI